MTDTTGILNCPVVREALNGNPEALEYLRLYDPEGPQVPEVMTEEVLDGITRLEWELYGKDKGEPYPMTLREKQALEDELQTIARERWQRMNWRKVSMRPISERIPKTSIEAMGNEDLEARYNELQDLLGYMDYNYPNNPIRISYNTDIQTE